jgi:hypothetical protein
MRWAQAFPAHDTAPVIGAVPNSISPELVKRRTSKGPPFGK